MEETAAPRKPSQTWRSTASSNWRMKDDSPRAEPAPRPQPRASDPGKENSPRSPAAILPEATPGTRLYVGNLLYSAQTKDIEQFFADNGFEIAQINMSTDPFTGRNPSYCFVDLETVDEASRAMSELNGKEILGRPTKINPGVAKKSFGSTPSRGWGSRDGTPTRTISNEYKPTFDRWSRTDASEHWKGQSENGKRLYVGGLPRIDGQSTVDAEMQALFEGFTLNAVSKIISPHPSKATEPGNHFYLFVDLPSSEEADKAIEALDGKQAPWGTKLKVNRAKGDGKKVVREQKGSLDEPAKDKPNPFINGRPGKPIATGEPL